MKPVRRDKGTESSYPSDEIEQQLAQLEPKFADLEQQLPELTAQVKLCKARFRKLASNKTSTKAVATA